MILAISPHTDDVELGCGGLIAAAVDRGAEVAIVALSTGNVTTGSDLDEFQASMEALGVEKYALLGQSENTRWGFLSSYLEVMPQRPSMQHAMEVVRGRYLSHSRDNIRDFFCVLGRELEPTVVLVPSTTDIHQDHMVVTEEAIRAFRYRTLLGYEIPHNHIGETSLQLFIGLQEKFLEKKLEAARCYRSQQHRLSARPQYLRALAQVRGVQAGVEFAEALEVIRMMGNRMIDNLEVKDGSA